MVNAQEWLNSKFSNSQRPQVKQLNVSSQQGIFSSNTIKNEYADNQVNLEGEINLSELVNLEAFTFHKQPNLTAIKGVEKLSRLVSHYVLECPQIKPIFTFLDSWKQEIANLKTQLAEYETESSSDSSEPLNINKNKVGSRLVKAIGE